MVEFTEYRYTDILTTVFTKKVGESYMVFMDLLLLESNYITRHKIEIHLVYKTYQKLE